MREGRLRRETVGFPLFVYRAVASVSLRAKRAPRPGYGGKPWKVSLCSWSAEARAEGERRDYAAKCACTISIRASESSMSSVIGLIIATWHAAIGSRPAFIMFAAYT